MQKSVRIVNSVYSSYTTLKSAKRMIDRHWAVWADFPRSIKLLPQAAIQGIVAAEKKQHEQEDLSHGIERHRGAIGQDGKFRVVVWWNGNDHRPGANHKPGEVVS